MSKQTDASLGVSLKEALLIHIYGDWPSRDGLKRSMMEIVKNLSIMT